MTSNFFNRHHLSMLGLLLFTVSLASLVSGEPHAWADNVCNVSVPIKKDLIVEIPVQYEIKYKGMCGILPCEKKRLETRTDQSIKTIVQYVSKLTCCQGYAETINRRCSPVCSDPCGSGGKCVEPEVCKCQPEPSQSAPGFTGSTCRRFTCLANNRWGAKCERECQEECKGNSYCSADTGKCVCNPGWHGANCSVECGPDDDITSGCHFISQMPPIVEPDANLVIGSETNNLVLSRTQKAEALKLGKDNSMSEDVDYLVGPETLDGAKSSAMMSDNSRSWAGLASSYMIGLLSVMSLILLVAFLIVKKRYEFVRNELYHASVASIGGRSTGGSSPGSDYSTSTYYSANGSPSSVATITAKNLDSNLNFAAATRNILTGANLNQADGKRVLLFSPKTESHLIRSQEAAKNNIYSEIDLNKGCSGIANRARAQTPTPARKKDDEDEHVYQVPKRSPFKGDANTSESSDVYKIANEPLLKQNDVSVELGDDNDSNIYEEIKPRNGGNS